MKMSLVIIVSLWLGLVVSLTCSRNYGARLPESLRKKQAKRSETVVLAPSFST